MWLLIVALASAFAAPLSAGEAVQAGLSRSLIVAEAEADLLAAQGELRATTFLQNDPQVQGSFAVVGDRIEIQGSQPLSLTGEGLAARRSAKAQVEAAEARLARARMASAAEIRSAWVAAVEARQRRILVAEALELASRLRQGAERRLEAGDSSLLDARLARLQEAKALSAWMAAVSEEGTQLAKLAALIAIPVEALELPEDPLAGAPPVKGGGTLRSDVEAAHRELEARQAALARERAAVLPPVGIGAFYEQEADSVQAGPQVSLTVPLWQRNAGGRAQAQAELHTARAHLNSTERSAAAEQQATERVLAELMVATERMSAEVPMEARAALESIAIGYESGELDLLSATLLRAEIIEGQQAWLEGRRMLALAQISLLLAHEDSALLDPDEVSP